MSTFVWEDIGEVTRGTSFDGGIEGEGNNVSGDGASVKDPVGAFVGWTESAAAVG